MATPASAVDSGRAELSAAAARGDGGGEALRRYSDCVDAFLQTLFAEASRGTVPSLVVALGGYGRRQLCLHSDVDLLLLCDGEIGAAEERLVRAVLHPLWDARFSVGHQIRQVGDFARIETDHPEFLIALLDARAVAGDAALLERVAVHVHAPATRARILAELDRLIDERHAPFNDTLYQLEPDVKDAPGALRDLWAARAIAGITDPALIDRGAADPARLDDAEEFLLRVRSILHAEHARNNNVLSHESQEKTARLMEYDGEPQQQVERLMGAYFRHARAVSRSLAWIRENAPLPVADNVVRSREGIRFVDALRAEANPASWLSLFQSALDADTPVADGALTWIQQRVERQSAEAFFPQPADRAALLAFLRPRAGLYARLSEMHDCGLVGRMFPEL